MGGMFSKPKVYTPSDADLQATRDAQAASAKALAKQEEAQAKIEASQAASKRARGRSGRALLLSGGEAGLAPAVADAAMQKTLGA